jgi:hypothetical protein
LTYGVWPNVTKDINNYIDIPKLLELSIILQPKETREVGSSIQVISEQNLPFRNLANSTKIMLLCENGDLALSYQKTLIDPFLFLQKMNFKPISRPA